MKTLEVEVVRVKITLACTECKQRNYNMTKEKKKSWFQGLQSEFEKIVWTDRPTLAKQTVVVVIITIILAVVISVMDSGILEFINFLMK